mgnify:CR=1 FL=1
MTADTTQRTTVEVKRKFRDVRSNQFLQGVIGGKFQVANQEDFSDSLTIHVIPHLKDNKFHVVHPRYTGEYRYFRYLSPDWSRGNMAELYTFNAAGDTLKHKRLMYVPGVGRKTSSTVMSFPSTTPTTCTAYGTDGNWNSRKTWHVSYSCRVTMTTSSAKAKNTNCSIGTTGHGCH